MRIEMKKALRTSNPEGYSILYINAKLLPSSPACA